MRISVKNSMAFHEPSFKLEAYNTPHISAIPFTLYILLLFQKRDSSPITCMLSVIESRKAELNKPTGMKIPIENKITL